MRELKFRAWDKERKYMVYDNDDKWMPESYPVTVSHKGIVYCKRLEFKPGDGNFEFDATRWENIEIMQYTGFKDAGGEELYDGDIFEDDTEWYQIKWFDEDGSWYACGIRAKGGNIDMQLSEFANSSTCWKQGNIYQNPEMLDDNIAQ